MKNVAEVAELNDYIITCTSNAGRRVLEILSSLRSSANKHIARKTRRTCDTSQLSKKGHISRKRRASFDGAQTRDIIRVIWVRVSPLTTFVFL